MGGARCAVRHLSDHHHPIPMTSNGHPSTALSISVSPLSGRSYHATCDLPKDTCVLDVSTPYAYTIYKRFRNEVCAECWRYECGTRAFLTCRDFADAGLHFCDAICRDSWLRREGEDTVEMLKTLESARKRNDKGKGKTDTAASDAVHNMTKEDISRAWEDVESQEKRPKALKQWRMIQLDDFQADYARYVLLALIHLARESELYTPALLDRLPDVQDSESPPSSEPSFGATWHDLAALQSGEFQQISRFPELLQDYITVYKVLRSRFPPTLVPPSQSSDRDPDSIPTGPQLADVITTYNVRTALSVEAGNSFGIWQVPVTSESEGLGFGVYPTPSFFNHRESYVLSVVFASPIWRGRTRPIEFVADIWPRLLSKRSKRADRPTPSVRDDGRRTCRRRAVHQLRLCRSYEPGRAQATS